MEMPRGGDRCPAGLHRVDRSIGQRAPDHPAAGVVVAWHVNNEYGGSCYCEHCGAAFRVWLRERYAGLEALYQSHMWDSWWTKTRPTVA